MSDESKLGLESDPSGRHARKRLIANGGNLAILLSCSALVIDCVVRYAPGHSFWLDEAFVAVSLRHPSLTAIFGPLEYGQYFPRVYLACIAGVRDLLGYSTWTVRLLPALCFVIATVLWGRLLMIRSRPFVLLGVLGAALLLGSSFWLDQAAQLKQYTMDVMLALLPFTLSDKFFEQSLRTGRRNRWLVLLALPCFLSYTYPMALLARVLGWYMAFSRGRGWRLPLSAVCALAVPVVVGLTTIWLTDYRFDLKDAAGYIDYWKDCSLRAQIHDGNGLRLIASYLWGWHGRLPLMTLGMVCLQALGVCGVLGRRRKAGESGDSWGSRSLGSIIVLSGVPFASLLFNYPICAGRTVLFCLVHAQILALEGGLFLVNAWRRRFQSVRLLYALTFLLMLSCINIFARAISAEAAEDLNPMIGMVRPELADVLWVHPCSCAQVRSLPAEIPVGAVVLGSQTSGRLDLPSHPGKVWVIWSHMGDRFCRGRWARIRCAARSWELVYEGIDSGLALAEF
jgi:hypothetical protein